MVFPDFQPMSLGRTGFYLSLIYPVFTSMHLRFSVHDVSPQDKPTKICGYGTFAMEQSQKERLRDTRCEKRKGGGDELICSQAPNMVD